MREGLPDIAGLDVDGVCLARNASGLRDVRFGEQIGLADAAAIECARNACVRRKRENPAVSVRRRGGFQVDGPARAPASVGVIGHFKIPDFRRSFLFQSIWLI